LFYRELGFALLDIQRIVSSDSFNKLKALQSHKRLLQNGFERQKKLLETVDKTIANLRGEIKMRTEELYYGFDSEKQKSYEKYLVYIGKVSQDTIEQGRKNVKHWKAADWDKFKSDGEQLNKEFVIAIEKNLDPASEVVQKLARRHYALIAVFWTPTRESYVGFGELYKEHPGFAEFFSNFHPKLFDFLVKAMQIFSVNELS